LGGTKPCGFLYSAAQTSQTAGTLCAIAPKILCQAPTALIGIKNCKKGKKGLTVWIYKNILNGLENLLGNNFRKECYEYV
jgi:hypothetical protein